MDLYQLLILQFIAHTLADFFLQSFKQAKEKNSLGFKSKFLKWHAVIVFLIAWILSFNICFVGGALVIAILHFVIDGLKKHIIKQNFLSKYYFFVDQSMHFLVILLVVLLFNEVRDINDLIFDLNIETKSLLIIAGYLICLKPSNIIIKEVFEIYDISTQDEKDLPNAGKLIGSLERLLVLTFILINQYEAVGFLLAAKSILRYKTGDTNKTEYVLIGTMLSFSIAIAIGVLINHLA